MRRYDDRGLREFKLLLTTQQAATILGVHPRRIIQLIKAGELDGERFGPDTRGGRWMVSRESVERLKEERDKHPPVGGWPQGKPRKEG